jgi:hypothetical protein
MKTFTPFNKIFCTMILGFAISLYVMAQTNSPLPSPGKIKPGFHLQDDLLFNPLLVNNFNQPFYKSTQGSFPRETHHFYWDVTTIWMADFKWNCTYNNYGNLLTHLQIDANTGDTLELITHTYDAAQRLTKRIYQIYNNGTWENSKQYYYEYDEHGNETIYLYYFWQAGWIPSSGTKHIYIYENNKIVEDLLQNWDQMNSMWVNFYKGIYTYDINGYQTERVSQYWDSNMGIWISAYKDNYMVGASGIVNEMISQTWDVVNSTWVNNYKHTNILWHQWNGEFYTSDLQNKTILIWNNGIWENHERIDCTWDANGSCAETHQQYFNGNWTNSVRQTITFDDHGNFILYTYEMWFNNAWMIDSGAQYLLTYDGNDLVERIAQDWDHFNDEWVNWSKEEYSDFFHTQGIGEKPLAQNKVHLYPNPTSGIISLKQDTPEAGNFSIMITNINGQVVYNSPFHTSAEEVVEIDLSGCAKGFYFVKLQLERETRVGKLILQ